MLKTIILLGLAGMLCAASNETVVVFADGDPDDSLAASITGGANGIYEMFSDWGADRMVLGDVHIPHWWFLPVFFLIMILVSLTYFYYTHQARHILFAFLWLALIVFTIVKFGVLMR